MAPAPERETTQAVERIAGGQLRQGQWWFGYSPDPIATKRFVRSLPKPTLRQAGPEVLRFARDDSPVLLYRALYEAHAAHHGGQQWIVGAQGIGDCVSWGWAHGANIRLAVDWKLGNSGGWSNAATEAIYGGSRVEARCGDDKSCKGGWGDGSYGGAAAKWVRDWGIVFRQPYNPIGIDLSEYDAGRAKQWGNFGCGGSGDNGRLDKIARDHPCEVTLVTSFEEAAAAIASGYPVPVCSGQGFSSKRDNEGFCRASGSWSHCMCFVGVRYGERPGLLCLNSWGPTWVTGPKWPDDQPDGSFWVDRATAERMLRGEDSFAIASVAGFKFRDLHHGDWAVVEPAAVRKFERRIAAQWPARGDKISAFAISP